MRTQNRVRSGDGSTEVGKESAIREGAMPEGRTTVSDHRFLGVSDCFVLSSAYLPVVCLL